MRHVFHLFAVGFGILFAIVSWAGPKTEQKEWTLLVFMNGHNNLDRYGGDDINEMEQVGSTDWLNLVVQWASLSSDHTRRLLVQKDELPQRVTSPILERLPPVDMGDYRNLVEFVKWGIERFPAKRYFVVVWNHGNGWHLIRNAHAGRPNDGFSPTDISNDDRTGNKITTEELAQAMGEISGIIGKKIDIYGSDACLMGMVEVAAEMADSVDLFVGAQELEPAEGWAYHDFLRAWVAEPNATPERVTEILTKSMVDSYRKGSQGDREATLSSVRLSTLREALASLRMLAARLADLPEPERSHVLMAGRNARSFWEPDYVDLDQVLELIQSSPVGSRLPGDVGTVRSLIRSSIVANQVTSDYEFAKGLSIWFPTDQTTYLQYSDRYLGLRFHQQTGWGDLLRRILPIDPIH